MSLFGDRSMGDVYDEVSALKAECEQLRKLVHEACKLAYEPTRRTVEGQLAKNKAIGQILMDAGLLIESQRIDK